MDHDSAPPARPSPNQVNNPAHRKRTRTIPPPDRLRLAQDFADLACATNDLTALAQHLCRIAAEGAGAPAAKLLLQDQPGAPGLIVPIPPTAQSRYAALQLESPQPANPTEQDWLFLNLLAQTFATARTRIACQQQTEQDHANHRVLYHELQHRVRNDLTVICGVAAREERTAAGTPQAPGFGRIAQLYDHLLGQEDAAEIDMGCYLQALCGKIAIAAELPSKRITLHAQTETLMLPADRAVRLGVAVNELITNAVEHAFTASPSGRIVVRLSPGAVSVADNGSGFTGSPPDGRGMAFVENLTRQAGATLSRKHAEGTVWEIKLST